VIGQEVCVELGDPLVRMAQHMRQEEEVRHSLKEMAGEGVPKGVRPPRERPSGRCLAVACGAPKPASSRWRASNLRAEWLQSGPCFR
jgi:hypothetical protein